MSIKIYNGIRVIGDASIENLNAYSNHIRNHMRMILPEFFKKLRKSYSFLSSAEFYREIRNATRGNHIDDLDITGSLCLFPIKDKILGIPYINHELLEHFNTCDRHVEYGYWNNVDPLETCTEEEWEQRKVDWDNALPGHGIPSLCGYTIDLVISSDVFAFPLER